jgi:adenylate cyclase
MWSVGFELIYSRDDTARFVDVATNGDLSGSETPRLFPQPTFVGVTQWQTQLVGAFLFTVLIIMTV